MLPAALRAFTFIKIARFVGEHQSFNQARSHCRHHILLGLVGFTGTSHRVSSFTLWGRGPRSGQPRMLRESAIQNLCLCSSYTFNLVSAPMSTCCRDTSLKVIDVPASNAAHPQLFFFLCHFVSISFLISLKKGCSILGITDDWNHVNHRLQLSTAHVKLQFC